MASVVTAIDGFIVNVSLPSISRDLGEGLALQQWTVDAYLISLGALILVAGSLSDLFGRKRVLMAGLVWFGIASLLCAVAPNGISLEIFRGLQGIGGALIMPSSLALILSVFSGEAKSKAIGRWTGWISIATISGPVIGGLILAVATWRWIFVVSALPIIATILLMLKVGKIDKLEPGAQVDVPGAVLCAAGLGLPVFALIEQPILGWGNLTVWTPLVCGVIIMAIFIWFERHTKKPMLPLSLFAVRNFSTGNIATLAVYAGLSISSFSLSIALQQISDYSALQASLATAPVSIIMFFMSSRFGKLAGRFGPRLFMTVGPLIAAIGFLTMIRLHAHVDYMTDLLPGVLLFGLGLSMTVAPLTTAVLGDVRPNQAGIASAVNNAVARIAGLVAIAAVGVVTGSHLSLDGFHHVLALIAGLLLVGSIVSCLGIRNSVSLIRP